MIYHVTIARNETTVYTYEVIADTEEDAEDKAYSMYAVGDEPIDEDIVYGEEEIHDITEIGEEV
jgi:hypothetical protein